MLEEGGVGDAVSPAMCKLPEELDLLMCGRRQGSFASWCTSNLSSFRYAKQRLIKAFKKKSQQLKSFPFLSINQLNTTDDGHISENRFHWGFTLKETSNKITANATLNSLVVHSTKYYCYYLLLESCISFVSKKFYGD